MNNNATPSDEQLTWAQVISDLLAGRDLAPAVAGWAMREIMAGSSTPAQTAGFLVAMQSKGVCGSELAAMVSVMLDHAVAVELPGVPVDTCGTGGDNSGSVNISTMAAVAVAATGRQVIKHGNRAATSRSGSADVLEVLGVDVSLSPELIAPCLEQAGIAFCFAPVFHPGMRHAGPVRRELGIPTVFNVLGPLANPARPPAQVVGVASAVLAPKVADALHRRGTSALVVRGEDGLDEITTLAPTRIWDCRGDSVVETVIRPGDIGIPLATPGALDGGDAEFNAQIAREALAAEPTARAAAARDAVIVNAAAAVVCADSATGVRTGIGDATSGQLVSELRNAVAEVRSALDAGAGTAALDSWARVSSELGGR